MQRSLIRVITFLDIGDFLFPVSPLNLPRQGGERGEGSSGLLSGKGGRPPKNSEKYPVALAKGLAHQGGTKDSSFQ